VFIVVVGAGRLGILSAQCLAEKGHSVTIIDEDKAALETLPESFGGLRMEGSASELDTLKRSRMEEADLVLAVTERDSLNLLVAQLARNVFGVPKVAARIYDPQTEEVYRDLDVNIVCPTTLALDHFLETVEREPPERESSEQAPESEKGR
jgi:trk system potassium uptake protein TrkA